MELKCDEFLMWDIQPHANADAPNKLALPVRFPRDTHGLPDRYRQRQLTDAIVNPSPQTESIESETPASTSEVRPDEAET